MKIFEARLLSSLSKAEIQAPNARSILTSGYVHCTFQGTLSALSMRGNSEIGTQL